MSGLFTDEAGAARLLGISRNHVVACIQRGELAGVVRLGKTVRIFVPALLMQGMGIDLATLVQQLGLRDLGQVAAFLAVSNAGVRAASVDRAS